jgi:hypothetical protein
MFGSELEEIITGLCERRLTLVARGAANGFNGLDAEGFDDGTESHGYLLKRDVR